MKRLHQYKLMFPYLISSFLYETININQSVVFCNSRKRVEDLSTKMVDNKFTVSSMHGDMDQKRAKQDHE